MRTYLKGLFVTLGSVIPIIIFIFSFPAFKIYTGVIAVGLITFVVLSFVSFVIMRKAARNPKKQLFISMAMVNMLIKMVVTVAVLMIYKTIYMPPTTHFLLPFLIVYLAFTIFETWFMVHLSYEKA